MEANDFAREAASGRMLLMQYKDSSPKTDPDTDRPFTEVHGHIYTLLRKHEDSTYAWWCRSLASGKEVALWPMDTEEITDA